MDGWRRAGTRRAKLLIASRQEIENNLFRECGLLSRGPSARVGLRLLRRACPSDLRVPIFGVRRLHRLLAIEDRVDQSVLASARVIIVKGLGDASQNYMKRDAGVFPAFDKRPVDWRDQHVLAPPAHELFLDFGEIVKVVESLGGSSAVVVDAFQWVLANKFVFYL